MISIKQIYNLLVLKDGFFEGAIMKEPYERDMTGKIRDIGINIEEMMKEIKSICEERKLNVGGHLLCTRYNVIPEYEESKRLLLDIDHLEGLGKILLVKRGFLRDY